MMCLVYHSVCFALLADKAGSHWASCQTTLPDPSLQSCSLDYPLPNIILLSLRKKTTDGSTAQTQRLHHLYLEMTDNLEKHVCYTREKDLSWLRAIALAAGHTKNGLDQVISCPKTILLILLHSLVEKLIYGNFTWAVIQNSCWNPDVLWVLHNSKCSNRVVPEGFGHLIEFLRLVVILVVATDCVHR